MAVRRLCILPCAGLETSVIDMKRMSRGVITIKLEHH